MNGFVISGTADPQGPIGSGAGEGISTLVLKADCFGPSWDSEETAYIETVGARRKRNLHRTRIS
jgi:hypothetical protein